MANRSVGYAADGSPKTYTTIAAAFAAASNGDNLQVYYADANKNRFWYESISGGTTTVVGIEGMLTGRQVRFVNNAEFYDMDGDLSGQAVQVTIQNIAVIIPDTVNANGIRYNDTSGSGGGVRVTNCVFRNMLRAVRFQAGSANVCQVDNCLVQGARSSGLLTDIAAYLYYNTVIGCDGNGIVLQSTASTCKNNASLWNSGSDFLNAGSATCSNNASSDATAPGADSLTNTSDPDDLDFWGDEATAQAEDYRIVTSSDLDAVGTPVAGLSADCDGNSRDGSNPSIGWHEGTTAAYEISATAPNAPDVSVARVDDTTARVTFSNSDPGVTNRVRYATVGDGGDNWSEGGSRSGDGTVDVSGLTPGQTYYLLGFSDSAGAYSEPSNVAIYTAGSASGATGAYAQFISDLYDEVRNSAALVAKVTSGTPTDHVKLGRFLNIDTDSKRHAALIANGPVIYLEPRPYSKAPRSGDHNRCEFSAVLQIFEAYDASAADTLITALNFVEALTREIMAESDGAGASWAACGCDVRVSIDGPREIAGLRDELVTSVSIAANWTEEL